ncbi:MAG: type II secretion system protein [Bacilli bacterium]
MNNKGFTLIELLAVIVILVGISLTTVMGISASLERRDVKECEEQVEIAKNAAKIYFSLLDKDSEKEPVSVGTLKANDYFDGNKVDRLKDDDTIDINGKFTGTDCSEE